MRVLTHDERVTILSIIGNAGLEPVAQFVHDFTFSALKVWQLEPTPPAVDDSRSTLPGDVVAPTVPDDFRAAATNGDGEPVEIEPATPSEPAATGEPIPPRGDNYGPYPPKLPALDPVKDAGTIERVEAIAADRTATIKRIKRALERRSAKTWSVTGGRGTAWGWLTIDAPPARRTWQSRVVADRKDENGFDVYEQYDTGEPGGSIGPADRAELAELLGLESIHHQGVSIAAGGDYYVEYIDRAEGREPRKIGTPYWD
jgi:hypothetical protein